MAGTVSVIGHRYLWIDEKVQEEQQAADLFRHIRNQALRETAVVRADRAIRALAPPGFGGGDLLRRGVPRCRNVYRTDRADPWQFQPVLRLRRGLLPAPFPRPGPLAQCGCRPAARREAATGGADRGSGDLLRRGWPSSHFRGPGIGRD